MSNFSDYKSELQSWIDQYGKEYDDSVSKRNKNHDRGNIDQKYDVSYYGFPTDEIINENTDLKKSDVKYWNKIKELSCKYGTTNIDPSDLFKEEETIEENSELGNSASAIATSPNPIRHSSVGMDQEMDDTSLGNTYTIEDLETIEELKKKLHDLEDQLNSLEGLGKSAIRVESKIQSVVKKINDLSDNLSRNKKIISPQGD